MTQMTELAAEQLTPARAAELTRVLDLKCQWEDMRVGSTYTTDHLHALQRAFEAYRVALAAYAGADRAAAVPDLSPSGPDRLRTWCRAVRAVLGRAGAVACPTHVVAKAGRAADKIAARLKTEPPAAGPVTDVAGAVRQLDAVIAWCERQEAAAARPAPALLAPAA